MKNLSTLDESSKTNLIFFLKKVKNDSSIVIKYFVDNDELISSLNNLNDEIKSLGGWQYRYLV